MTKPAPARATLATLALTCGIACAAAAATQAVPLTAARWQTVGKAEFVPTEGFPDGLLKLGDATADLKGLSFGDGTIEYDAKLLDAGFASFRFRTQGPDSAELFYLRDDGNCPAADDCIQYVPMIHGVWPWEMYPEYQTHAAITVGAWNHVKLVISGRRMNVFINGAVEPTLAVGRLEAAPLHGGLQFSGPAEFANLTVSPGITHSLPSQPDKDPTDADPNLVRRWAVATTTSPLAYGAAPSLAQMPADPAAWASLPTERHGPRQSQPPLRLAHRPFHRLARLAKDVDPVRPRPQRPRLRRRAARGLDLRQRQARLRGRKSLLPGGQAPRPRRPHLVAQRRL